MSLCIVPSVAYSKEQKKTLNLSEVLGNIKFKFPRSNKLCLISPKKKGFHFVLPFLTQEHTSGIILSAIDYFKWKLKRLAHRQIPTAKNAYPVYQ